MEKIEVSFKISGNQMTVVNKILTKGFTLLWKVKTIDKYYCKPNSNITNLKEKCLRLRKVESLSNDSITYYFEDYSLLNVSEKNKLNDFKILKEDDYNYLDETLKKMNFKEFLTTNKIDYVLKKENYIFQIQDIKDCGLIVSYDNEDYSNYNYQEQKSLLIADLEKFGFQIVDYEEFDKFKELITNKN